MKILSVHFLKNSLEDFDCDNVLLTDIIDLEISIQFEIADKGKLIDLYVGFTMPGETSHYLRPPDTSGGWEVPSGGTFDFSLNISDIDWDPPKIKIGTYTMLGAYALNLTTGICESKFGETPGYPC